MRRLRTYIGSFFAIVLTALVGFSGVAYACGGLIGPNGTVQLLRTSTLVAHHDGVEHYVTSFKFQGEAQSFGSIIPLPDVPTDVRRGGDWTLQRLEQEVRPPAPTPGNSFATESAGDRAEVLLQTTIDSLEITILKGGGDEVVEWATENGFELSDDIPAVLGRYAERSPIFMAAKFDAEGAAERGFRGGDGIPIQLTIPTEHPWIPLQILSVGKDAAEIVEADLFMLTDDEPDIFTGRGVTKRVSEAADPLLLDDLRSDTDMEWVPESAWFTHLTVETPASELNYDLAATVTEERSTATTVQAKALANLDVTNPLETSGPIDATNASNSDGIGIDRTLVLLIVFVAAGFLGLIVTLLRIPKIEAVQVTSAPMETQPPSSA